MSEDEGISFDVGEAGAPNLAGEGEDAPPPDDAGAAAVPVPDLWSPEEAAALFSAVFNVGVLIYGREWAADPAEFRASGTLLAPHLDQWMPKSAGGGYAQLGVGLLACAGELAGATARRWPIIKRGPRPVWVPPSRAKGAAEPGAPAQAEPGAPAPDGGTTTYRLPKDLVRVVTPRPDDSLSGLGM